MSQKHDRLNAGDDAKSRARYFFHTAPHGGDSTRDSDHFHIFLQPTGIHDPNRQTDDDDDSCHLIGLSISPGGLPTTLFTTNRWVTGKTWYPAQDVIRRLDAFIADFTWPIRPLDRWIAAMLILYCPQIEQLLFIRDIRVQQWAEKYPDRNVYEDRELEITSKLEISE